MKRLVPLIRAPVVVYDPKGEYDLPAFYDVDAFLDSPDWKRASVRVSPEDMRYAMDVLSTYTPHVIVLEEAHAFASPRRIEPELEHLVRMGRLPGISLVLVTQRARDLHQLIYSMVDHLVVFQQRSPYDLDAISYAVDENVERITTFGVGQFAYWKL